MIVEKVYTNRPFKKLLIIKETPYGLHGEVKIWNSFLKKWEFLMSASFYYRDNDATIFRVKQYFNFNTSY